MNNYRLRLTFLLLSLVATVTVLSDRPPAFLLADGTHDPVQPVNDGHSIDHPAGLPELTPAQAQWIGERIFQNECGGSFNCLTSWNSGEDFPSLGIGHFIWYRSGQREAYRESFPSLMRYFMQRNVTPPAWILSLPGMAAPWDSRQQFMDELEGPRLNTLREFLHRHKDIQTEFIIRRLYESLPEIIASAEPARRAQVRALFNRLGSSAAPHGAYALIDYVNFKGEGSSERERYRGQGWGLLQVLEHMLGSGSADNARTDEQLLKAFQDSAEAVLRRRVANAPPERGEERWLAGWHNRLRTYLP